MKILIILIIPVIICGCSNFDRDKAFYTKNAEILEREYEIKKKQYDQAQISYRGNVNKSDAVDSLEKILQELTNVSTNDKKNKIIKQVYELFLNRRAEVAPHFFDEIKNCNYEDKEKIKYYSSLIKLTFVNTQLIVFYQWQFSFDCLNAICDAKINGDSIEIFPRLLANNFYRPNFVLVGNDTLYFKDPFKPVKYKYKRNDSLLAKAELYFYSVNNNSYSSIPLFIKPK